MKLTLLQEKLKEGLAAVERICSKSFSLPMLNNVLLKAGKNFLCLEATNLEMGLRWWILAKTESEGKIALPSHLFSNFISLLPNKKLELETLGSILKIKHNGQETKIKGFSGDEFPIIPEVEKEHFISIDSKLFSQGLDQVADLTGSSASRPEISGVYFLLQKNQLVMAATDSFRLGEKKIFFENSLSQDFSFILPQRTAREIINIFGEREGIFKLYFSSNQIMAEFPMEEIPHPKIQLISKLIEGEYPNYQEILPKRFGTQLILKKDDLLEQIKLASLFAKKTNELRLKIDSKNQRLEFFCQNPDIGEYKSDLLGEIKGPGLEIAFNYKFLLDGLAKIKSPEIIFSLESEENAGLIKPKDAQDYVYVVMPMKGS
jgi:DNA polymerase-3 subunit beta